MNRSARVVGREVLTGAGRQVWDARRGQVEHTLTGHTSSVTSVRWGGQGLIYTGSEDRTIKVWDPSKGILCRSLDGHAHWVNHLALSTDAAMRNAPPNARQAALSPQQRCDPCPQHCALGVRIA